MAVCYIWEGHPPEILRGLIRECLLRSMGFPGLPNLGYKQLSLLNSWNGNEPKPEYVDYLQKPFVLLERDQQFLELLYSSKIHAGMDYLTARKILEDKAQE